MKTARHLLDSNNALMTAKKARQEKVRSQIRAGQKTQQSMFLIQPSVVKEVSVIHRVLSFD